MISIEPAYHGARLYPKRHNVGVCSKLGGLLKTVDETFDEQHPDLLSLWEPAFVAMLLSGEIQAILTKELQAIQDSPLYNSEGVFFGSWVIAQSEKFVLYVEVLTHESVCAEAHLLSLPGDTIVGVLSPAPLEVSLHELPANWKPDVFERHQVLTRDTGRQYGRGDFFSTYARRHVPYYDISQPVVLIKLASKVLAPLIWAFDRNTLTPVMASASSILPSRLQTAAQILQHLVEEEQTPPPATIHALRKLVANPSHFVRWTALQSLCAIDFDKGKDLLLAAQRDPHPHVANAAVKAVQQLAQQGLI